MVTLWYDAMAYRRYVLAPLQFLADCVTFKTVGLQRDLWGPIVVWRFASMALWRLSVCFETAMHRLFAGGADKSAFDSTMKKPYGFRPGAVIVRGERCLGCTAGYPILVGPQKRVVIVSICLHVIKWDVGDGRILAAGSSP